MKQSGILGFWRGIGALTSRATIVGICQVAMYDQASATLRRYNEDRHMNWSKTQVFVYASCFTSVFYSFVTMPIEMARVRMSSQLGSDVKYKSVLQTIVKVGREEGVWVLARLCRTRLGAVSTLSLASLSWNTWAICTSHRDRKTTTTTTQSIKTNIKIHKTKK